MPRDGNNVYSLPPGTTAVTGEVIKAALWNTAMADVVGEFNSARPVSAGGTGATTETAARANLGLGSIATKNEGTGAGDFRDNAANDARFVRPGDTLDRVLVQFGTPAAPSYAFGSQQNAGFYYDNGQEALRAALAGESVARFSPAGPDAPAGQTIITREKGDARYLLTTGKAADSDKLDGFNSSQFLRSDANDVFEGGVLVIGSGADFRLDNPGNVTTPTIQIAAHDSQTGFHSREAGGFWATVAGENSFLFDADSTNLTNSRSIVNLQRLNKYVDDENIAAYTGNVSTNETNFKVGQVLPAKVINSTPNRQTTVNVRLSSDSKGYEISSGGTQLAGTWLNLGANQSGDDHCLVQRIA